MLWVCRYCRAVCRMILHPSYPQKRKKCEGCGLKHPTFGLRGERKRRWCRECAQTCSKGQLDGGDQLLVSSSLPATSCNGVPQWSAAVRVPPTRSGPAPAKRRRTGGGGGQPPPVGSVPLVELLRAVGTAHMATGAAAVQTDEAATAEAARIRPPCFRPPCCREEEEAFNPVQVLQRLKTYVSAEDESEDDPAVIKIEPFAQPVSVKLPFSRPAKLPVALHGLAARAMALSAQPTAVQFFTARPLGSAVPKSNPNVQIALYLV